MILYDDVRDTDGFNSIGVAQTTNVKNSNNSENFVHWAKIIRDDEETFKEIYNYNNYDDSNGLIFNVKCH